MDGTVDCNPSEAEAASPRPTSRLAYARGAARANLASALGMVWGCLGAPGSILLTLFMKEWLQASKWQIGLVLTMTYLGPVVEPAGAFLVEHYGRRKLIFLSTFLLNRLSFFAIAAIPLLGTPETHSGFGLATVFLVVGCTRIVSHLGTPAWWSWMADMVPEHRRGRFFGCRSMATSLVSAVSYAAGMLLLQLGGGMANSWLVAMLFAIGAGFGTLDILLYLQVPEPPHTTNTARRTRAFATGLLAPFRSSSFRTMLVGMGLWSFVSNLVLPFVPVYQRGETASGVVTGLGVSWLELALLTVAGHVAAMLTSKHWGHWLEILGPRVILLLGSGFLFSHAVYFFIRPEYSIAILVLAAFVVGGLNAAWTVSTQHLLLSVAPTKDRSFYISAHNSINGIMMAAGPLLGGYLADHWSGTGVHLPGGPVFCYFHILLALALAGAVAALAVLVRVPALSPAVRLTGGSSRIITARVPLSNDSQVGRLTESVGHKNKREVSLDAIQVEAL